MRTKLITFRNLAEALARAYMNHDQRQRQILIFRRMVELERLKLLDCDYRNRLNAICDVLDYIPVNTELTTHAAVKAALWLVVTLCNQAISDGYDGFSQAQATSIDQIPF